MRREKLNSPAALPERATVHALTPRLVLVREKTDFSTGKQGRLLSPKVHPGSEKPEPLVTRLIRHRLLAEFPQGETDQGKTLLHGRAQETAYIYRKKGDVGVLEKSSHGGSLNRKGRDAYALQTREALKHPLRTFVEAILPAKVKTGRVVLVDFGEPTPEPPQTIQLSQ